MNYYNYNGKSFEENKNVISAANRGLRYGDGLFETIKSIQSKLLFADDHFARLWKGMNLLRFKLPKLFTPDSLQNEILELLKKNSHENTARIRITVFRGDGGLYDDISNTPNYLIQTWALPEDSGKWNSNGLVLGIYPDVKKSCDILSNLKHNNFLPYVMAALYAKEQKWNDAIILNSSGHICDSTIANVFLVKDEMIVTPALDEGCIAGIMRRNILQQLKSNNIPVIEGKITVDDLMNADEIFLTNSIYNMRWVQAVAGKNYDNAYTQKIYSIINQTFY
jgi:branched-chain amino acid aminotransferase